MRVTLRKAIFAFLIFVAAVACALGGALAWYKLAPRRVPEGQAALLTLDSGALPEFRDAFNAAEGEVRVLALLSPT